MLISFTSPNNEREETHLGGVMQTELTLMHLKFELSNGASRRECPVDSEEQDSRAQEKRLR